jgi:hypothetical protein
MAFQSVTLAQLRQRLRERWEEVPYWSDEEARIALNEALHFWNLLTGAWRERHVMAIHDNDPYWALPAPITYPMRVEYNGIPLDPTSLFDMDNGRPQWESETTATSGVPTTPQHWMRVSLQMIAIWPMLDSGEGTLVIDGVANTPALVNDADFVDLDEDHMGAILAYALHVAAFKEGGTRFAGTMPSLQAFVSAAAEHNSHLKSSAFYNEVMGQWAQKTRNPTKVGTDAGTR